METYNSTTTRLTLASSLPFMPVMLRKQVVCSPTNSPISYLFPSPSPVS